MRSSSRRARSALLLAALGLTARAADAHHAVLRFNLEELTVTADRVFIGRCVGIEGASEHMAGGDLAVTRYSFDIEQVLKGELPARFTFTEMGLPARTALKGGVSSHGQAV